MKKIVAVIGGGPAGMMAAGRAGELGAQVILLEKNPSLGIKLLATGHGRCNLSNDIDNNRELAKHYGRNGSFLFSAFHKFDVARTKEFFEERGVSLKVEASGRIFPQSDRARDVLQVLEKYLKSGKVDIEYNSSVKAIVHHGQRIEKIILSNNLEIIADEYILAVGGRSYPKTGSSGDGYRWLKSLGHSVITPRPVLAPIIIKDHIIKNFEGLSLKDVSFVITQQNKKIAAVQGEAIVTADGFSGPAIFALSRQLDLNTYENCEIHLDFFPVYDQKKFDAFLVKLFSENPKKTLKNVLQKILPPKFIAGIEKSRAFVLEKKVDEISREERQCLAGLLKNWSFRVQSWAGFEKAMVTAGGVNLKEVDPKTLKSKIIDNLYFAGEILDLDGPTGGFNLQMCWSTGFVAGEAAAE